MSEKFGWLGAGTGVASTQETGLEFLLLKISPVLSFMSPNLSSFVGSPQVSEVQG